MKKIFSRSNGFILLMILSTFTVAGSAAYYSVFGLSSLFAGARFEVIIMAGALELAKLVTASYLHNNWKRAGWMKWYLTLAVGVLMIITSLGIYGFLTSAYQTTADQLGVMEKQINVIELKKDRFQEQLDYFNGEKSELTTSIADLRNGITNNKIQYTDSLGRIITTQSSSTRRLLQKELDLAVTSRGEINVKIESLTDSITKLDLEILDLESNNEVAAEIGPLRYMAELTGKPMNIIVNWFTLLIVFVFDPLAIAMVIALNKLIGKENNNNGDDRSLVVNSNSNNRVDDSSSPDITPVLSKDDGDEVLEREEPLGKGGKKTEEKAVEKVLGEDEEKRIRGFKLPDEARGTTPPIEDKRILYGEEQVSKPTKPKSEPKHQYGVKK